MTVVFGGPDDAEVGISMTMRGKAQALLGRFIAAGAYSSGGFSEPMLAA